MSRFRSLAASAALGCVLAAVAFGAAGATHVGRTVALELVALALSGAVLVGHALRPPARPWYGASAVVALGLLTAVTLLSLSWTVAPDDTLKDAGRSLTYLAVFAASVAGARLWPAAAPIVTRALLLAGVAVTAWALITRIFPGELAESVLGARLGEPFGYWNALGGMAALTLPAALWLGGRGDGGRFGGALAYPAMGVLLLTLLLTQSRGALVAAAVATALWLIIAPMRTATLPVILLPSAAVAPVAAWALSKDAFTKQLQPLEVREAVAGDFGLMVLAMVVFLTLAGYLIAHTRATRPRSLEFHRRAGLAAGIAAATLAIAGLGMVAASDRGLAGNVSDRIDELASTKQGPPEGAARLGSASSSRGEYWRQAKKVLEDRPFVGAGADAFGIARLEFRDDFRVARHAHGFLAQTLADLGLVGGVTVLVLLALWLVAAARTIGLGPRRGPRPEWTAERAALLALALCAVAFGAQSFVDWTWFVPGPAIAALVAAGFVAGRGPLEPSGAEPVPSRPARRGWERWLAAGAVVLAVGVAALVVWQPERAARANDEVQRALQAGDLAKAERAAKHAREVSPDSREPLFLTARVLDQQARPAAAYRVLEQAVIEHPQDPEAWLRLATFELDRLDLPGRARATLVAARRADPRSRRVEVLEQRALTVQNQP